MIAFKDNSNRGKTVKIFFYIMLGLNLISACSNYFQYTLLQNAANGIPVPEGEAQSNDLRQQIIGLLTVAVIIGSMITFIMWYYRAYKNLHALNITSLNFEPGWAIGAWFVPFLNLGRPFVIMREIWNETQYYFLSKEEKPTPSSSSIVGWWWTLWIIGNLMGNISFQLSKSLNGIGDYITFTQYSIVYDSIDAASVIVALLMMNQVQGYEKQLKLFVDEQNNIPPATNITLAEPVIPVAPSGDILNTTPE